MRLMPFASIRRAKLYQQAWRVTMAAYAELTGRTGAAQAPARDWHHGYWSRGEWHSG
jgi:hypothetical protein